MSEDHDPDSPQRARILDLNDQLRTQHTGGTVLITRGVQALGALAIANVLEAVRSFEAFTPDNDPYGEHDFGNLEVVGTKIFFKIDYYDPTGTVGSEDPADPKKTLRVMTIMLAEEY